MKLVREHINEFKQGQDPYDTMGVGSNRGYADGDKVICKENLFYSYRSNQYYHFLRGESPQFIKNGIYTVSTNPLHWSNTSIYYIGTFEFTKEELNEHFTRL
jgi:uncharacterized protein with NRDE domain